MDSIPSFVSLRFPSHSISESFRPNVVQDLRIPLAASSHNQNIDFRFTVLNIAV